MIRLAYIQISGLKGGGASAAVADYSLGAAVTVISGPNGSGKTTIHEGLAFLLGHRVAGLAPNGSGLLALLDGESMSVTGEFIDSETSRKLVVRRTREVIKGRFKRASLTIDGQEAEDEALAELLGDISETPALSIATMSEARIVEIIAAFGDADLSSIDGELSDVGIDARSLPVVSSEIRALLSGSKRALRDAQAAAEESRRWAALGEYGPDDLVDAREAHAKAIQSLVSTAMVLNVDSGSVESDKKILVTAAEHLATVATHVDRVKRAHQDEDRCDKLGQKIVELSDLAAAFNALQAASLGGGLKVIAAGAQHILPRTWSLDMEGGWLGLRIKGNFIPAAGLSSAQRAVMDAALGLAFQLNGPTRKLIVVSAEADSMDDETMGAFTKELTRLSALGVISQALVTCWRSPIFTLGADDGTTSLRLGK